jgi:signal transduction histidine kinase/ActR/RegA family two-component response regulator
MSTDDALRRLEKRYEREREARKQAEQLLEERSLELYRSHQQLQIMAVGLEEQVAVKTAELRTALSRAESSTLAKSRFLATMSHELRTPLNGILGLCELLLLSPLNDEQRTRLSTLQSSGHSLLSLLNDILDFSKIEAGHMSLELVPVSPAGLLHEVIDLIGHQARLKGLGLTVEIDPEVPEKVLGDGLRLRQVWLNLLGNAVKFTEQGWVKARLQVSRRHDGTWLQGQVLDTGVGISAEAKNHIFQPFVQADSSISRQFGGTGLGLVITQKLIEIMGGRISLDNAVGQGCSFRFEWPVDVLLPQTPVRVEPATSGDPLAHEQVDTALRILVADDHPVNRHIAQAQLKALGLKHVTLAHDGEEALAYLRTASFDVVFMDVQMPRLDGLQTTRALREMPLTQQPWVVAMTANAYEENRQMCLQAGMNSFLAKPFNLAVLRQALQEATAARQTPDAA